MSSKLNTYEFKVRTNSGTDFVCLMPATNYMDAVSKFSTQGFAVAINGRIVLTTAINDFAVVKLEDGIESYKGFAEQHSDLLKGLRLM